MDVSSQLKTLLEGKITDFVDLDKKTGSSNKATVFITVETPSPVEDEGLLTNSEYVFFAYEIHVEDVVKKGEENLTDLNELSDNIKIKLKKVGYTKLTDYVKDYGSISSRLEQIIIDRIVKPIDFGNSVGLAVTGRIKLFQTIN